MPIVAHNETVMFFYKTSDNSLWKYSINNYHNSITNSIIILRLKLFKLAHSSSI